MDTLTDVLDCNDGATMHVKQDASELVRQAVARAKQVNALPVHLDVPLVCKLSL